MPLVVYPYGKRFTWAPHAILGVAQAVGPVGAWIAVTGHWSWSAALLGLGVGSWIGGFDLIYATQDVEVDRAIGVKSFPARWGVRAALVTSTLVHVGTFALFVSFGLREHFTGWWYAGLALTAVAFAYEHSIVKTDDLSRVNRSFFVTNGFVGITLFGFALVDLVDQGARRMRKPWIVGVSGASGTPYAAAVLRGLLDAGLPVDLVVSRAARLTLLDETGLSFRDAHWREDLAAWLGRDLARDDLTYWPAGDLAAGPSSGSYETRGMVVVPASTASVAGIAIGLSKDLLQRAADVTIKERRPLVVVPRETPLTRSTLAHLLTLADQGVTVLPASPAFYYAPRGVQQLVDFVAGKVLDVLGVEHSLFTRWAGELGSARRQPSRRPGSSQLPKALAEIRNRREGEGFAFSGLS